MAPDQTEHVISASNILFGLTRFLALALPADWRMRRSYLEPDVHSNVRRGDTIWVEAGQADQIVYHPSRKIALDLTVLVKRGKRDALKTKDVQVHSGGSCTVNGHEAAYFLGEMGIGFLKRKRAKTLRLALHCSELGRTIMLGFTGTCHETDLLEIFACLSGTKCH